MKVDRLEVASNAPRLGANATSSVKEVKVDVSLHGGANGSAKRTAIGLRSGECEQKNSGSTKR